jgi:hypothetical protein
MDMIPAYLTHMMVVFVKWNVWGTSFNPNSNPNQPCFYILNDIKDHYVLSDFSCARQHAGSLTFIASESLFPIGSPGEYYLKVSKSQPANTKVSRQLAGQQGYDSHPGTVHCTLPGDGPCNEVMPPF